MLKVGSVFNPFGIFTGIWIPNCIVKLPPSELSSSQKIILGRLYQYGGRGGECYPKQDTLAEEVGLSNSAVREGLNKLVEKGFIKKIPPTGSERLQHKNNRYVFLVHPCMEDGYELISGPPEYRRSGATDHERSSDRRNTGGPIKRESYKENPIKTLCAGKNPARLDSSEEIDSDGEVKKPPITRKRSIPRLSDDPPPDHIVIKVDKSLERNKPYLPYVQRLAQIVYSGSGKFLSKQTVQLNAQRSNLWANEFRLLCTKEGVAEEELNTVLDWYADHAGGEYVPIADSGTSFREKWPRLLAAMERSKRKNGNGKRGGLPVQGKELRRTIYPSADIVIDNRTGEVVRNERKR